MDLPAIPVFLALLLCSLVAGFLFAFAVVVMPGLRHLPDHDFLRAFRAIDRVIQKGQPLFLLVWLGSPVALVTSAVLACWQLDPAGRAWLISAAALHVLGVQLPTAIVNIPLNNQLQRQDLDALDDSAVRQARRDFEPRWVRWNSIRTIAAIVTTILVLFAIPHL